NQLLAILHWTLRILQVCLARIGGVLVLLSGDTRPMRPAASAGGRLWGHSIDFDSARWKAVSRSGLWFPGFPCWSPLPALVRVRKGTAGAEAGPGAAPSRRRFGA